MSIAREFQTATLLASGKVLVAGGDGDSAELYDPRRAEVGEHGQHEHRPD